MSKRLRNKGAIQREYKGWPAESGPALLFIKGKLGRAPGAYLDGGFFYKKPRCVTIHLYERNKEQSSGRI
jgi:hypothetical protein